MSALQPRPSSDVPDTAQHRALAAVSRVRMLNAVRQADNGMTAAEVAEATGLHPSTVRAHLDQLVDSGLLTRDKRSDGSPGRPAWRYRAVPRPEDTGPIERSHRDLAAALIGHLARSAEDPHAAGVSAGRDWGRSLASPLTPSTPIKGLIRVLDRLGFTPQVVEDDAEGTVVYLRSCPFLELAEANPDVVCGVHLGVIGGALGTLGAGPVETDLRPFAVPGACVVHLRGGDINRAPRAGRPASKRSQR